MGKKLVYDSTRGTSLTLTLKPGDVITVPDEVADLLVRGDSHMKIVGKEYDVPKGSEVPTAKREGINAANHPGDTGEKATHIPVEKTEAIETTEESIRKSTGPKGDNPTATKPTETVTRTRKAPAGSEAADTTAASAPADTTSGGNAAAPKTTRTRSKSTAKK